MFLKLEGRSCLVVGAGKIGESKIRSLLVAGATVRVIAPRATPAVLAWERAGVLAWQAREFESADLDSTFLVVAATSVAELIGRPGSVPDSIAIGEQARAETIRRLAIALDEQRRQLDSGTAYPVAVRCLGPLQVQAGTVDLTHWRSGKARSLFEYLVTHRGRVIPRDTLIEVLWPDPGFPGYASITGGFDGVPVPFGLDEKNKLQPGPDERE